MPDDKRVHNYAENVFVIPYLENMNWIYDHSEYILCRAGATTLSELSHRQIKSIIVPYPYSKDDHQQINAQIFCEHTNNICLYEEQLTVETFKKAIDQLDTRIINPVYTHQNASHMIRKLIQKLPS